jgi:branched-chain amino acid transport system ATP-binding protein
MMNMNLLKLRNVQVNYGPVKAIQGVDLNVEERSIVALVGANGAGKSTLLKSIMGLVPISSGDITFANTKISDIRTSTNAIVSQGIALSPEGRRVFSRLSVLENLILGSYSRHDKIEIKADLEKVFGYFPILRERVKQQAGSLSGGQQQMLAIGRALMAKPRLLLLDEPSLGLAPLIVKHIGEIIRQLNMEGCTILLVEQNARMALKLANYAYVLESGRVVLSGTGSELLANDYVEQVYLGSRGQEFQEEEKS